MDWGTSHYFSPSTDYAGQNEMQQALRQYFAEMVGPQAGGQAQLAAGRASAAPAEAYQGSFGQGPNPASGGPAMAFNNNAFSNLMSGERGARQTGRQVGSDVTMNAEQGIANVGNAYAGDVTQNIQAQMQLEQAKAAQSALEQQQIMGLTTGAAGIAGSFFGGAPIGGLTGIAGMAGKAAGFGAQPAGGGAPPPANNFSSMMDDPEWLKMMAQYGHDPMMGYGG